jgi:hypothetical protein
MCNNVSIKECCYVHASLCLVRRLADCRQPVLGAGINRIGETIMMWDAKQKSISYWYFTTAGFQTQGKMEIAGKTWASTEDVTGNASGITKVRSTTTMLDDGNLHVKSEYFANDKWTPGHEITYKLSPNSQVNFR